MYKLLYKLHKLILSISAKGIPKADFFYLKFIFRLNNVIISLTFKEVMSIEKANSVSFDNIHKERKLFTYKN